MTPDSDLDLLLRGADPAAGRQAPPVDTGPLALAAVRAGLSRPAPAGTSGPVVRPADPGRRWLPVAASVAAVVAVVGLVAVVAEVGPDLGGGQTGSAGLTTAPGGGGGAKPGQGEHTASSGPEYDRAKRLLGTLQDSVPAGFTVPDGGAGQPGGTDPTSGPGMTMPTIGPDGSGMPAAYFQAVRDEGPYQGYQGYEYLADTIVSKGPQVGSLAVRVWVGVPEWSADPCVVVERIYWNDGSCRVVTTAGGERVAVVDADAAAPTPGSGPDRREEQWAGYRRADGPVVLVAQGPGVLNDRIPALDRPVFTAEQLAMLATDERFAA